MTIELTTRSSKNVIFKVQMSPLKSTYESPFIIILSPLRGLLAAMPLPFSSLLLFLLEYIRLYRDHYHVTDLSVYSILFI
jgi:hypothetical protein